jgi:hypothetical protein
MQLEALTPGWAPVHVGLEGAAISISGVNPWRHINEWRSVQKIHIIVSHPSYPHQRHRAWVYEVTSNEKIIRFAATELSNGVWGFYVPRHQAA